MLFSFIYVCVDSTLSHRADKAGDQLDIEQLHINEVLPFLRLIMLCTIVNKIALVFVVQYDNWSWSIL